MRALLCAVAALMAASVSGCTVTFPEGVIACTSDDECPPSQSCRASRCFSIGTPDAGTTDAATEEDAAADASPDATPDAANPDPRCPASGPTNPDCPWYFGEPHAVPTLHPERVGVFGAALANEGRLVYVATPNFGEPIYGASRPNRAERFSGLMPALGSRSMSLAPGLVSITEDGLEIFAQVADSPMDGPRTRVLRYVRSSVSSAFAAPEPIESTEARRDAAHPSITSDGLELFFTSNNQVYVTRRASRADAFQVAEEVGFPPGAVFPRVTPDGLGIFVGFPAQYATRPDRTSPFGAPAPLPLAAASLGDFGLPTYVPATRELWYVTGLDGNRAAWSSATTSLWRVRVCRDAACPATPSAEACPPGLSVRSADRLHCYFTSSPPNFTWGGAESACGAGLYLASLSSDEERGLVAALDGGGWIGASDLITEGMFTWTTGERFVYDPWISMTGQPDDATGANNCVAMAAGIANDLPCTTLLRSVCEQSIWPTW